MHTFSSIDEVGFTPIFLDVVQRWQRRARVRFRTAYQARAQAPLLELGLNGHRIKGGCQRG